ncbi:hypothetical protein FHT78_004947 [Rhizobium sp. BK196]|jgi:hypothetical protein|uniref:hypothetical protein n=1 Tax=Rhizobium sp. BK196 TaxID=2587073 RepID=UPI0016070A32|nr:hypothetical protein [Rhizobium sp. BK196]MBB3313159.1 hypothetical protein [Rhizobium sp. BK196]
MILAIGIVTVMGVLAVYANRTVAPGVAKLPMQWSLKREVSWTAPRAIAFALIPVLAAGVLAALVQSNQVRNTDIAWMGGVFLACQLLHITLTHRWFNASRR